MISWHWYELEPIEHSAKLKDKYPNKNNKITLTPIDITFCDIIVSNDFSLFLNIFPVP